MENKTELFARCEKTLSGNWPKLGFAAALMLTVFILIFALIGMPMLFIVSSDSAGILSLVFMPLALCCMYSLIFTILYGFFVLVIRMYKNEYVTAGFLFYGLRDWKRLFRLGSMYMVLLFIVALFLLLPLFAARFSHPDIIEKIPLQFLLPALLLIVPLIIFFMVLPYVFSFYYLYETQGKGVSNAVLPLLKKSRMELKGKKLLLVKLCFLYAKKEFAVSAAAYIASQTLAIFRPDSSLASFMGFVYSIAFYLLFIKAVTLCTAFYYGIQQLRLESPSEEISV